MSRLSIYETRWIDLVFENRNQEYGAYQLRRDSSKTLVLAFVSGISLIAAIGILIGISNALSKPILIETPTIIDEVIRVTPYSILPEKPKAPVSTSQTKAAQEPSVLSPMVVAPTQDITADIPTNKEATENSSTEIGTEAGTTTTNIGTGTAIETPVLPIDPKEIINPTQLDKLPEFPGGMNKFYNYVGNNFEKPDVEGVNTFKVYVAFVIEKDGSMTDIKVLRDPGFGLGKEAIRVLKSLKTKWSPGILNGKSVRTAYNLPISVQIQ